MISNINKQGLFFLFPLIYNQIPWDLGVQATKFFNFIDFPDPIGLGCLSIIEYDDMRIFGIPPKFSESKQGIREPGSPPSSNKHS